MDNLYTVGNNIVLLKKQPVKRLSAQKVNDCQRDGNAHSDTPADPSVLLCLFGWAFPKAASNQCDCGNLHTVAEREGQPQNIHSNLMCRHCRRSQSCRHHCSGHKANPHQHLFNEYGISHFDNPRQWDNGKLYFLLNDIGKAYKIVFFQQGTHTHDACNDCAKHGGDGSAVNAECRKTKVPIDKQVITNDIHDIWGDVCPHGNNCISGASLRRIDAHGNHVKNHSAHDNAEINDSCVMCVLGWTAKMNNLIGKYHTQGRHNSDSCKNKKDCCQ